MKILVIRRDNIGDLVCTTPMLSGLRRRFPDAHIAVLVNSYNAPVLAGNPDIDEVCVYRKAKHRATGQTRFAVWWATLRLLWRLRGMRFDIAIIATPGKQPAALTFARWVAAKRLVAYGDAADGISDPLSPASAQTGHETQAVMRLLEPLGVVGPPGPASVFPDAGRAAGIVLPSGGGPLIALHLSARKPLQRWPVERFAELAHRLHARRGARFLLFWSPGAENHPQHPGDDAKAEALSALCADLPLLARPTDRLEDLVAGLAHADRVICSDGGAMHLAAGLGKPIVCFFGNSGAGRWHPWGVTHELLQAESRNVGDISVADALAAVDRLERRIEEDNKGKQ
ncbi:MAG: glycosyltransferase family 9 protein [Betaproteobacteria bacterium]|nr:glycosyltransferase family 9 protein [Betaproteobacteria bacterium]